MTSHVCITDIWQYWGTTTLSRLVKGAPKTALPIQTYQQRFNQSKPLKRNLPYHSLQTKPDNQAYQTKTEQTGSFNHWFSWSTQPLGLLCLWQCLFLHVSREGLSATCIMLFTWPLENRAKSRGNRVSTKSANSGLAGLVKFAILRVLTAAGSVNCQEPEQESLTHLLNQNKMTYSLLTPSLNQGCSALLFVTRVGVSTASSISQLQTLKANWSISLLVGAGMVECFTEWNSTEASSLHEMWFTSRTGWPSSSILKISSTYLKDVTLKKSEVVIDLAQMTLCLWDIACSMRGRGKLIWQFRKECNSECPP